MRKLQVDLGELAMAFEDASWGHSYYLDLETGQVVWVSQEAYSQLEGIYQETYDPEAEEQVDLATVLQDHDLADWQQQELLEADRIERFHGSRYIRIPEPAPAQDPEPETPTAREQLLAEALAFVRAASRLQGVTRIALIGSLTTEEPDPKDADLLVTVTDDMDLAPLARLGRKLQGHTQSFARGGEVFLADPRGNYLGRTCSWKRCGPGIRISCDALNCGWRSYLHDDLETICLDRSLVLAPPIELWPQIVTRVPVSQDVEQELLLPLREDQGE